MCGDHTSMHDGANEDVPLAQVKHLAFLQAAYKYKSSIENGN